MTSTLREPRAVSGGGAERWRLPEPTLANVPGRILVQRFSRSVFLGLTVVLAALAVGATVVPVPLSVKAEGALDPSAVGMARAAVSGVVEAVLVETGDSVARGTPILRLSSPRLLEELEQLRVRKAQVEAEYQLAVRVARYDRQRREQVARQAAARVRRERAQLRDRLTAFGIDLAAAESLARQGGHLAAEAAVAQLDEAEAALHQAVEDAAQHESDSLAIVARRAALRQVELQLIATERRAADLMLLAPLDGIVVSAGLDSLLGASVVEGEVLMRIADARRWRVSLPISERDVHFVSVGDAAELTIAALEQGGDGRCDGRVVGIAAVPLVDGARQYGGARYAIEVEVLAPWERGALVQQLRTGLSVRATIVTRRATLIQLLARQLGT